MKYIASESLLSMVNTAPEYTYTAVKDKDWCAMAK
jgi:hypothetical protein